MKNWSDIGFTVEKTMDGSPSLRLLAGVADVVGEAMHHSGGAWSETDLIYGEPLRTAFAAHDKVCVISVGLGLGYVELLAAKIAIQYNKNLELCSYEIVPELRQWLIDWLQGHELHPEVQKTYDQVGLFVCEQNQDLLVDVKAQLLKLHSQSSWEIRTGLSLENLPPNQKFHVITYDAFSGKTSPELWEQNFLENLLKLVAGKDCLFSTYACRAALKNALKNSSFDFIQREGFMGKRNSTLGLRGKFKS